MRLVPTTGQKHQLIPGIILSLLILTTGSCGSVTDNRDTIGGSQSSGTGNWSVPKDEVVDGGPGRDGIPAIDNPQYLPAGQIEYVANDRFVVGVRISLQELAYPYQVMDWHEIVNENEGLNDVSFVLTVCPLTGTALAWKHHSEMGVSGLLFRNNLIPYDRDTGSLYSQMQFRQIKGNQKKQILQTIPVIQTTWNTWKRMYPHSKILTTDTGYERNYDWVAYPGYQKEDSQPFFPVTHQDDRLLPKERVHGVFVGEPATEEARVRTYVIDEFGTGVHLIQDQIDGKQIIVAGSSDLHFAVSFYDTLKDGTRLQFEAVKDSLPVIMKDREGNRWDIFGHSVTGPRAGTRLSPTTSYTGYWFAWADFFPGLEIYQPHSP